MPPRDYLPVPGQTLDNASFINPSNILRCPSSHWRITWPLHRCVQDMQKYLSDAWRLVKSSDVWTSSGDRSKCDWGIAALMFDCCKWRTCCNFTCCFLGQYTLNQTSVGWNAINLCNNPHIEVWFKVNWPKKQHVKLQQVAHSLAKADWPCL